MPGDAFNAVKEDRIAREIAEHRKEKKREEVLARNASTTLEELFSQIQEGEVKELNLIVKGDVQGSVGAIVSSLEKLSTENVRVKIRAYRSRCGYGVGCNAGKHFRCGYYWF